MICVRFCSLKPNYVLLPILRQKQSIFAREPLQNGKNVCPKICIKNLVYFLFTNNYNMKTTPFTDIHIELGAKMHEFAGYNMPIEYTTGIIDEHLTVSNGVGVFDVSHMGEFWVKGPNSLPFLQKTCSNNIAAIPVGKAQYNCFPNGKGGIIDDLIVYLYEHEKYLLVVNAANIDKDWEWVNANNSEGAILENASDRMAQLAIQG